jgi:hypothetical protein
MPEVQKIACVNDAGFVMSFYVEMAGGLRTESTDNYPIDQSKTIDLGSFPITQGTEIWPVVHAVLGKTESGSPHVNFAENGQTATYEVKGATLDFSVDLIGQ